MNNAEEMVQSLGKLVYEREQAHRDYKQYQHIIDNTKVLDVNDGDNFVSAGEAYKKHCDLIEKVKHQSEIVADNLPVGLQFGLRILGKPLFVAMEIERMQSTGNWHVLVASASESEIKNGIKTVIKYDYDVKTMKVPS